MTPIVEADIVTSAVAAPARAATAAASQPACPPPITITSNRSIVAPLAVSGMGVKPAMFHVKRSLRRCVERAMFHVNHRGTTPSMVSRESLAHAERRKDGSQNLFRTDLSG